MSRIFSTLLSVAAVFGILFAALAPAQAAVVYSFGQITGESSIVNNGDVLLTHGGTGTINGIGFSQSSNSDGVTWNFASGMSSCSASDFSNQFTGGLDAVLSSCSFQNSASNTGIFFHGLNVGEEYSLQLMWSNILNSTGREMRVLIQGESFFYNIPDPSQAYSLLATFTASASSELVLMGRGTSITTRRSLVNGFVFSGTPDAVPAPGALLLLGFGLIGLGAARRTK